MPKVLQVVTLAIAMLQAIPACLGQLQKVKSLNLDANRITSVPSEVLMGCHALHTLLLHSNPISAEVSIC